MLKNLKEKKDNKEVDTGINILSDLWIPRI